MFLLGAFLAGSAVGYAADRAFSNPPTRATSDRSPRDSLAKELGLTDPQRRAVDSIFEWSRARRNDIMKPVQPSLDAARDSARVLILQSLDSAQRARFRSIVERPRGGPRRPH